MNIAVASISLITLGSAGFAIAGWLAVARRSIARTGRRLSARMSAISRSLTAQRR